ncbi:MAG: hypothetical protein JO329_23980 [Planctomycetaceae bacterium]|nr:hypothetical protein [Planctomycetaceae bacterium]MBV8265740.1 hypothetical protein [Planctomycetaceae bacterium]MBV8317305.1 hypothetical protein [Planctomycetaceae bacterium]MBV8384782.1 hypothetical protein [Planctomycetaceae bacterium]MBV8558527.1 hypothetical protein [Planctomycetaceae bacterium]
MVPTVRGRNRPPPAPGRSRRAQGGPQWRWVRPTIEACRQGSRSCRRVEQGSTRPVHGAAGSGAHQIRLLHVAGHRESKPPGIGARGERSLADVFRRWGHAPR